MVAFFFSSLTYTPIHRFVFVEFFGLYLLNFSVGMRYRKKLRGSLTESRGATLISLMDEQLMICDDLSSRTNFLKHERIMEIMRFQIDDGNCIGIRVRVCDKDGDRKQGRKKNNMCVRRDNVSLVANISKYLHERIERLR